MHSTSTEEEEDLDESSLNLEILKIHKAHSESHVEKTLKKA